MATPPQEWLEKIGGLTPRDLEDCVLFAHQRSILAGLAIASRLKPEILFTWRVRRPHTDDMMQMCVDLGVDVPDARWGLDLAPSGSDTVVTHTYWIHDNLTVEVG